MHGFAILRLLWANFVNICECSRQEICGINVLGKQYVQLQFNFVNICEGLDNCAWICHFETVVGKLCMEANFVNVCECSRQEICRINVLGKQYMQFNFVNICECS